jgi:hypothetical protein
LEFCGDLGFSKVHQAWGVHGGCFAWIVESDPKGPASRRREIVANRKAKHFESHPFMQGIAVTCH